MKPDAFHVVRRDGTRFVFLNQAGQSVEVPGGMTLAQLLALGIVVRLHLARASIEPDTFLSPTAPL